MTSYTISLGYNSGYTRMSQSDDESRSAVLEAEARALCQDWPAIVAEAQRLGAPDEADGIPIGEFGRCYAEHGDLTVAFGDESDELKVRQAASGGGESRSMKEHLRRAFCRLMLERMHRRGVEIDIRVG